eukprot:Skav223930  [mRNA]  locus=scaffold2593:466453:466845:+ [translate_table: standard]
MRLGILRGRKEGQPFGPSPSWASVSWERLGGAGSCDGGRLRPGQPQTAAAPQVLCCILIALTYGVGSPEDARKMGLGSAGITSPADPSSRKHRYKAWSVESWVARAPPKNDPGICYCRASRWNWGPLIVR